VGKKVLKLGKEPKIGEILAVVVNLSVLVFVITSRLDRAESKRPSQ
jgi:hypothetical protein